MRVKDLIKNLAIYNQDMEIKVEMPDSEEFKTLEIKKVNVKYEDCIFLEVIK